MQSPATWYNAKDGQSVTPITYPKNYLKPPIRKLWEKEDIVSQSNHHKDSSKWDKLESPQFVDFENLPDIGDSFFGEIPFMSTPITNSENVKLSNTVQDDTLVAHFNNISLSNTNCKEVKNEAESYDDKNEKCKEEYVVHDSSVKMMEIRNDKCNRMKKPLKTVVNPFTFETRDKYREQRKQERINQILEEEKKMKIFRAKPVPKFLKSRPPTLQTNRNNNNNNHVNQENGNNNANEKAKSISSSADHVKKNAEVCKKPLSLPYFTAKHVTRAKTPPLKTTIRAQQRKRFDETLREKERQRELLKQMEIAAKKKQEQEELLRLRKQTVHKAQPIRRYKTGLPNIDKRPLTDPISPISLKRRRRM